MAIAKKRALKDEPRITKVRADQLERRLRRLRNHPDLWSGDAEKEARVTRLIKRCKKDLTPYWDSTRTDFAGLRMLQTYA